jgi:hypothetical protein
MFDKIMNALNETYHLYWNTLRVHKKVGRWWHRGADVAIVITTKCNLHCSAYCPMFLTSPKYPRFDICTLEEWKTFIEHYPQWISNIFITGGETSSVPYISEFTNWLVDRGHHVCIFSNLNNPEAFYGIKRHWRFVLIPTFHHDYDDAERYKEAYDKLKDRFRVASQEMEDERVFSFSRFKKKFTVDWFLFENQKFHFAPDSPRTGKVYLGCNKVYIDGK